MSEPLLTIEDLTTSFRTDQGVALAVDGVSLEVHPGEVVGIVGESGCGKSTLGRSIIRLVRKPGRMDTGRIRFAGKDLTALPEAEMRTVRGKEITMIFQEPMTSLNPVYTVGFQLSEAIRLHTKAGNAAAYRQALELLRQVGIPEPEQRMQAYPHQLSGGMCQRVMIAMALACQPKLLIADEPTTALDVTVQAQILELMKGLGESSGLAILLITHDLGVVAEMCDRVVVMYAGQIVEEASVWSIFQKPRHPYTEGLLHAIPALGVRREKLSIIPGTPPNPQRQPAGCRFHPRCPYAVERCRVEAPALRKVEGVRVACHRAEEIDTQGVT